MVKRKQKQLEIMFTSFQEQDLKKKTNKQEDVENKKEIQCKAKESC